MTPHEAPRFLIQVVLLMTAALVFGRWAERFKIPCVAGELLAGLLLGPSVLGSVLPGLQMWFFPVAGGATFCRLVLARAALLVFLFSAGLETQLPTSLAQSARVLSVSVFGLAVPFVVAWAAATAFPGLFGLVGLKPWFPLFLGTALSISALPVIARIFMDLHLEGTSLAAMVLSAAAIDDLVGWALFVFLLRKLGVGGAFSMGTLVVFFAGAMCGKWRSISAAKILRQSARLLFAPLYFVGIGLQINLWKNFSASLAATLLGIACVGKILGAAVGARLMGMSWRTAGAVGCAMNARGAMEIILATVALEQGIITPSLHAGLVFVALATSLMAGPCLNALYDPKNESWALRPAPKMSKMWRF